MMRTLFIIAGSVRLCLGGRGGGTRIKVLLGVLVARILLFRGPKTRVSPFRIFCWDPECLGMLGPYARVTIRLRL